MKYKSIHRILLLAFLIALAIPALSLSQEGKIEWGRITSPSLEGNLLGDSATKSYAVYLPPSYETSESHYPSAYLLHGYGSTPGGYTTIKPSIDSMIRNGNIGEMIIVFVDGYNKFQGSFYHSSDVNGDYEGYITKDLVEHIDSNYRTLPHRKCRGITGHSMGGHGSMYLAVKYPDVYSVVVSQGGFYHNNGSWTKSLVRGTASVDPKNWGDMNGIFWMTRAAYGYLAGTSPDPDNPPFFVNSPYKKIDGKVQEIPDVMEKWLDTGIVDGELDRYLQQPYKLDAIKIIHGKWDGTVNVSEAQALDQAMTDKGIEHTYEEHGGGHEFVESKSLQFLSDNLSFDMPEEEDPVTMPDTSTAVQPVGKLVTTWANIRK